MIYWPAKTPGETEDFAFDFTGVLQSGENIASHVVMAVGVTKASDGAGNGKVTVWLSGGTLGTPGIVTCSITTDSSPARTFSETAILPIGEEPVTLDMAKRQCRAESATGDDEQFIADLIQPAREYVERYCGIRIVPAAAAMTFDRFADLDRLTQAPVQSITAIQYRDANGVQQTLDPAVYEFANLAADELRPAIRLAFGQAWPSARAASDVITVSAVVGYTAVPRPIIRAILLLVAQWYDIRTPVAVDMRGVPAEIPNAVSALLANFRR